MRILVIAYEFPPSPSPGSLRWRYLARELAMNGHDVEVLAPALPQSAFAQGVDDLEGVRVIRTFAGPLVGFLAWRSQRRIERAGTETTPATQATGRSTNWKYRVVQSVMSAVGLFLYPDSRSEWRPWATRALRKCFERCPPDVVISAHEPATTLQLGLLAFRRGIPWIADVGDPVLAPYTPRRWRRRAARLESKVCRLAAHVVVTTEAARSLLMQRHGLEPDTVSVMTQGFEDRSAAVQCSADIEFEPSRLELLYSGRFYDFRKPGSLLAAVAALEGVRLSILSPAIPDEYAGIIAVAKDKVRYLGTVSHGTSLRLQRRADVLVNIGNDGLPVQIPGKFYEYLGSGRPLLHLSAAGGHDSCGSLVESLAAGWVCENNVDSIRHSLEMLIAAKHSGSLERWNSASPERVAGFGWSRIGERYSALLEDVVGAGLRARQAIIDPPARTDAGEGLVDNM